MSVTGLNQEADMFPVSSLMVDFQVRNGRDPLLVAKRLTGESLDFGMSAHDLRVLGVLVLIISVLAAIRPLIVLCQIRTIPSYRHQMYRES